MVRHGAEPNHVFALALLLLLAPSHRVRWRTPPPIRDGKQKGGKREPKGSQLERDGSQMERNGSQMGAKRRPKWSRIEEKGAQRAPFAEQERKSKEEGTEKHAD